MHEALAQQLDLLQDRSAGQQRSRVETAKLVSTFSTSIAAALAGTALQVEGQHSWDVASVVALGLSFIATLIVVILDRLTEVDEGGILQAATVASWTDDATLTELRVQSTISINNNREVVNQVQIALVIQVVLSICTGALASISLLL